MTRSTERDISVVFMLSPPALPSLAAVQRMGKNSVEALTCGFLIGFRTDSASRHVATSIYVHVWVILCPKIMSNYKYSHDHVMSPG